ncbi:MAG: hypothetical protein RJA29_1654 [Pseudomonadota bacterium]
MFLPQEIIRKKRDKNSLSPEEIDFFIDAFAHGQLPDYQMAALAMALSSVSVMANALLLRRWRGSSSATH